MSDTQLPRIFAGPFESATPPARSPVLSPQPSLGYLDSTPAPPSLADNDERIQEKAVEVPKVFHQTPRSPDFFPTSSSFLHPSLGSVADEIKHMVEKHVAEYLNTRAIPEKVEASTNVGQKEVAVTGIPSPAFGTLGTLLYWLTLLDGLCGSVNSIWNVLGLLRKARVGRVMRMLSERAKEYMLLKA